MWKKDHWSKIQLRDPTINEWLIKELDKKYGISNEISKKWIEKQQLVPILDGLDELETNRQEQCILAINEFLSSKYRSKKIVVSCRKKEYENYKNKLQLNGAIFLKSLTPIQVQNYLIQLSQESLWQNIKNDLKLFEVAQSPLLLNVMILAYEEISIDEWQEFNTAENRLEYLWDSYIKQMLKRYVIKEKIGNNKISNEQFKHWLSWLAKVLKSEQKKEFLIETIQPNLLEYNNFWIYCLVIYILFGVYSWNDCWQFAALIESGFGYNISQIVRVILGLIALWYVGTFLPQEIKPRERFEFSYEKLVQSFSQAIIWSTFYVFIIWRIHTFGWEVKPFYSLFSIFLIILFVNSFQEVNIKSKEKLVANQGIWNSLKNSVLFSFIGFCIEFITQPQILLISKLDYSLLIGLIFGGTACIKHFILRLFLWKTGCIPWNYANFLDNATECLFLQRHGGRYEFIHDLLKEHFANLNLETDLQSKKNENILEQKINENSREFKNRWTKNLIIILMIFIALVYIFISLFFSIVQVHTYNWKSMSPSLQNNQILVIEQLSYFFHEPQRGDIILIKSTSNMKESGLPSNYEFYRRIIGLPGEQFTFKDEKIYKEELELNLVAPRIMDDTIDLFPPNTYLVLADNMNYQEGLEDRAIAIDKKDILGKVYSCLYPFNKFGKIDIPSQITPYIQQNFDYDKIINKHRHIIYNKRLHFSKKSSLKNEVIKYAEQTMDEIVDAYIKPDIPSKEWDLDNLVAKVKEYVYLLEEMEPSDLVGMNISQIKMFLHKGVRKAYGIKEQQVNQIESGLMREAERFFILQQLDSLWREYIQNLDILQKSLELEYDEKKELLNEYSRKENKMFIEMMTDIRRNVVYSLFEFKPELPGS